MRIAILGAGGRTGVRLVRRALEAGVALEGDPPSFIRSVVRGIMKLAAGAVLADSEAAALAIAASGLDWTLVRAPMLSDEPSSGRLAASGTPPRPAALSRDEIAGFLLECAETGAWSRSAPFLSLGAPR